MNLTALEKTYPWGWVYNPDKDICIADPTKIHLPIPIEDAWGFRNEASVIMEVYDMILVDTTGRRYWGSERSLVGATANAIDILKRKLAKDRQHDPE